MKYQSRRLRQIDAEHLVYESPKPGPGGRVSQILTPLELLDRLAALIPPPRRHRHRYYGVLAPNAPLRSAVTALAAAPKPPSAEAEAVAEESAIRRAARYAWALLLARIYEVFPLTCPKCGGAMRIIAFIDEGEPIRKILQHLGEPITPPKLAPGARPAAVGDGGTGRRRSAGAVNSRVRVRSADRVVAEGCESHPTGTLMPEARKTPDSKRPTAGVLRASGMIGQRLLHGARSDCGQISD